MLKYLAKANDTVAIFTTDDTDKKPDTAFGFRVSHTLGFRFPLYDHICVSLDLREVGDGQGQWATDKGSRLRATGKEGSREERI